jgi:ankyrin repeat protein
MLKYKGLEIKLKELGRLLIDQVDQDCDALIKEVIANFLQLSKDEREDFLSFIQRSTIAANISEDSPQYPLKNILILSITAASDDVISKDKQLECLDLLLTTENINQKLIAGPYITPLEKAVLGSDLPTIRLLVEKKNAHLTDTIKALVWRIKRSFRDLPLEWSLKEEDFKKAITNFECYDYILRRVELLNMEAKDAAKIVIQLSAIIKEAIEANKGGKSRETIEPLIGGLKQLQNYIESQIFETSQYTENDIKQITWIKRAILELLKLDDGSLPEPTRLEFTVLLGDIDKFKIYTEVLYYDKNELLIYACRVGNFLAVKYLVEEKGAQINIASEFGNINFGGTPLTTACGSGNIELTKYLIAQGAEINLTNQGGERPLTVACRSGNDKLVEYLVEELGDDINALGEDGCTALMEACRSGKIKTVEYLVEKGANIDAVDQQNFTPIKLAYYNNHFEVVKYLIKRGVNINGSIRELLTFACQRSQVKVIQALLEAKKIPLEWCEEALKMAKGHLVIEGLLMQYLLDNTSTRMEGIELSQNSIPMPVSARPLNQNFTPDSHLVPKRSFFTAFFR